MTAGSGDERALTIGAPGPAGAELIAALTEAGDGEAWSADTLARLLALPGSFALVAESGGEPVGFILVQVAADESEIVNFAVAERARRRGAGRMLLTAAIERVREAGAAVMFLEVACDNAAARSLYRELGFKQVALRSNYYRRGPDHFTDALILRRDLITTAKPSH